MARQYKTGLIITGDASGGIRAVQATDRELGKLNRGFDRGTKGARQFGQRVNGTSRELQLLRRAAAPIGGILAGMFAGRALQGQIDFANNLLDINTRLGVGTEALSEYAAIGKVAGVEIGSLTTAWQRQARRISEAAQGTGVASDALEALNLNARELNRLAPEDQFERITAAMQGVADAGDRVRLAQQLWDSGGVQLLQIVNQGTDAIQAQREEFRRWGLTISTESAQAMAAHNAEMHRLQLMAQGVSRTLLAELVPSMTQGLQSISSFIDGVGGAETVVQTLTVTAGGLATLMAGRYAGSLYTATLAKTAAIRESVRYQATLATMAGVSGRAAASQIALGTAARGAAGALALVGGPAGAAVIAGAAIYTFREELGLVEPEVEASTTRVLELTGSLQELGRATITSRIAELTADLHKMQAQAAETRVEVERSARQSINDIWVAGTTGRAGAYDNDEALEAQSRLRSFGEEAEQASKEVAAHEEAIEKLEQQLERLNATSDITPPRISSTGEASKEAAKAAEEQANALESLRREMSPGRSEVAKYAERTQTLNLALASGAMGATEHGQSIAWATQQYLRAATGAEEYEQQTKSLLQQYDQQHRRARQLHDDLALISQRYRDGALTGDEYGRMLAAVREEMAQLAFDADPMAQDMARAWEEAGNRIDETFADAFRGAFDSFDDFRRSLLDGFKRLLAELAYQATLRPIVVQMTASLGGALGLAGPGQALAGQGVGAASMGGGLWSNLGRMTTGNSIGQGFMGAGNWLTGQGIGQASGFGSQIAGTGNAYAGGGIFSGAGAVPNWQFGLAGIGGGLLGSQFGGHGGIGGSLGATGGMALGSSMASLGSFGGPIGALAGGVIGGALGSLFGGSSKSPNLNLNTSANRAGPAGGWIAHGEAYEESPFGYVGIAARGSHSVGRVMSGEDRVELLEAMVAVDQLTASLARTPEELDAMASAVQSVRLSAGSTAGLAEQAGKRTSAAIGALDGDFGEFVSSLDGGIEEIVARAMHAQEALGVMGHLTDQLSLRFDAAGDGALMAADSLSQMMGGIDAIAASAEAYYELTRSEGERQADALNRAYDTLEAFEGETGIAVESAAGLRQLVEGLDLTSETAQELYAQAMDLIPALSEVEEAFERAKGEARALAEEAESSLSEAWSSFRRDSVRMQRELLELAGNSAGALAIAREQELEAMDAALRPFQERIWTLQDEAEAISNYQREYERAENQLESTLQQIARFIDQTRGTAGTPSQNLEETERQFWEQLARAESGDRAALQSITQYADRFMQSGQDYFASGEGFQAIQEQVLGALEDLPNNVTAEEFLADEIREALRDAESGIGARLAELGIDVTGELGRDIESLNTALAGQLDTLAAVALTELAELQQLHDETRYQVDQLVSIDSSVLSVRDAIIELGVAQDRVAELEADRIRREEQTQQQLDGNRNLALDALTAAGDASAQAARVGTAVNSLYDALTTSQTWARTNRHLGGFASGIRINTDYMPRFALGGTFTNSVVNDPTLFNMAEMGEAGPEAIMPLHRGSDGSLGIRAELPPLPPLLGMDDVTDVLRDLQREVRQLREDNHRMQERLGEHAAAAVAVQQAGFKRLVATGERTAMSNEDLARQAKLEAMR